MQVKPFFFTTSGTLKLKKYLLWILCWEKQFRCDYTSKKTSGRCFNSPVTETAECIYCTDVQKTNTMREPKIIIYESKAKPWHVMPRTFSVITALKLHSSAKYSSTYSLIYRVWIQSTNQQFVPPVYKPYQHWREV